MSELTILLELFKQHAEDDTRRFASVQDDLAEIKADVKSLLEARSYARGAWWATAGIASIVSAIVAWVMK